MLRSHAVGLRVRRGFTLAAAALALVAAGSLPVAPSPVLAAPTGLPTHFGFGVGVGQGDTWMPGTGLAWDYRMQYLAGGANTNAGWETWNGNGTFALNYANESAQHGYIPVFPYYELLQSSGPCGACNENQKDITNLNTPGLMQAYYANFALLMKRLGPGSYDGYQGFGKTAVINIEPDFTGGYAVQAANNNGVCFGYCTGQGNDPSLLKASVASSGYADVAAYPNTYAGFIQALAHLRDKYAPNVLLGLDISSWATGTDIGLDSNPSTNSAALGQQVGTFLSNAGPHDLLFNDPLDRDAGQYKALFGQNRWWDRLNVTAPNFVRWEQYLHGVSTADRSRSVLLWQVPAGNQYFQSENNTDGHYQDNRAEYIFGHISELISNGIIGAVFMPGNAGSTSYGDAKNDGTTNPPAFCTSDGVSSGQVCNSHASTVPDDDGGYIRMSARSYYSNPVLLSGATSPTATPTATSVVASYSSRAVMAQASVAPAQPQTISAQVTASANASALVDLEVYDGSGVKVVGQVWDNQAFTAGQTRSFALTWTPPASAMQGTYSTKIGIFSPGWGTLYNWNDNAGTFSVGSAAVSATATASATPTRTPTAVPTNTPTATPSPGQTSTPAPTTGPATLNFITSAAVFPNAIKRGGVEYLAANVWSESKAATIIDLEIYDASGAQVWQQYQANESFAAGEARQVWFGWNVPADAASGTYTVKVGVFATDWSAMYTWNDAAATFAVV